MAQPLTIIEDATALAQRWEHEGHPLSSDEPPVILFDPQARETVLQAVALLKPETAQSFLEAIAACPPLCDFGLQALSRQTDASKPILETLLDSFLRLANRWEMPKHGLRSLAIPTNSKVTLWAIDVLFSRFDSVTGEDAWEVQQSIATSLGLIGDSRAIDGLLSRFDSVSGEDALGVRLSIVEALRIIGDSRAIDGLLSRFDRVSKEIIQIAIIAALVTFGDSQAINGLLSRFDSVSGKDAQRIRRSIALALEDVRIEAVPVVWTIWNKQIEADEKRKMLEKVLFQLDAFSPGREKESNEHIGEYIIS